MHQNTTKEDFKNNNSDTQSIDNEEETSVITDEVLQESTNIQEARIYEEAKGKQKLNNYQKDNKTSYSMPSNIKAMLDLIWWWN